MQNVREPAVAGFFYPGEGSDLLDQVDDYLEQAPAPTQYSRVLIAPHAGYDYSGPFAATAYRALDPGVSRVLILGPTHRVGIDGMALAGAQAHVTPLGLVETDRELTELIEQLPAVITAPVVHAQEHSIEVHLPFLQRVLGDFTVVPLAVGNAAPEDVSRAISTALGLPGTAVIISSDLSHYHPSGLARNLDGETVRQIVSLDGYVGSNQACGAFPVNGLLHFARNNGWAGKTLALGNSSDTAGDEKSVVGYASIAWYPEEASETVLDVARDAIGEAVNGRAPARNQADLSSADPSAEGRYSKSEEFQDQQLENPGASFVTLTLDGRLRGCIGSLRASRALGEDVAGNAVAAAFSDPRFPPVTAGEFPLLDIEVSVLGAPEPLLEGAAPEDTALGLLQPGRHGVVWTGGGGRATFLPQVWEDLPDPGQFIRQLKRKAGVDEDYWGEDVRLQVYTVSSVKGPARPSR